MKRLAKLLFWTALVSTLVLLVGSLFINLNGEFPGVGHFTSVAATWFLFGLGGGSAATLLFLDRRRILVAGILLSILTILALPLLMR